jgi:hypothetical protein
MILHQRPLRTIYDTYGAITMYNITRNCWFRKSVANSDRFTRVFNFTDLTIFTEYDQAEQGNNLLQWTSQFHLYNTQVNKITHIFIHSTELRFYTNGKALISSLQAGKYPCATSTVIIECQTFRPTERAEKTLNASPVTDLSYQVYLLREDDVIKLFRFQREFTPNFNIRTP